MAGASVELAGESRRSLARRIAQTPTSGPYSEDLSYTESDRNGRYAIAEQLRPGAFQLCTSALYTSVSCLPFRVEAAGQIVNNFVLHRAAGQPKAYATRTVLYVTERRGMTTSGGLTFGPDVAPHRALSFGSVPVSVPLADGEPVPPGHRAETLNDLRHHAMVQTLRPLSQWQSFVAAVRAERGAPASSAVLLFVHGYNQSFDQAVRAAAQLRAGLNLDVPVIAYDWPSEGDLLGYLHDEDQVTISATNFVSFVERLARELPGSRIEIVAHSMGNRLVTVLIEGAPGAPSGTHVALDHVLLTAPDVTTSTFTSRLTFIPASTGRIAIYASRRDQALLISSLVHKDARLGYFEDFPATVQGMDTIDATDVDTSILGHGYFVGRDVLTDMRGALADQSPPRSGMQRIPITKNYSYWRLTPP